MTRVAKAIVAAVALCAIVAGASAAWARRPGGPGPCECAPIDAPVLCANGVTYGSACIAACAGQTNCEPTGGGGIN